ncbi:MAG: hypothetical protein RIB59_00100 [Rhodospirillales bacterium]
MLRVFVLAALVAAASPGAATAADTFRCLKASDIGIDNILAPRPVQGDLKEVLRRCGLLKSVETVRYFTEKAFDRGALVGLGDGCIRWVYYLNLADLTRMTRDGTCPR